ncbi:MAG: hypothetical protein FJW94_14260 [Actinobacteria bacterium]|nr:hypothetical protein [Actinomycetota bacterium]MBM4102031.1 hypothetical protein [Phycisphaerae bacterium]
MRDPLVEPFDPIARLRVLAAALPGSVIAERTLDASFDQVWQVIADLETMTPRYEHNVSTVEVTDRDGARATILVTTRTGHTETMDVRLVLGWCLMHSPSTVVAFAARDAGNQTLLAHLELNRTAQPASQTGSSADAHDKLMDELHTIELLSQTPDTPPTL